MMTCLETGTDPQGGSLRASRAYTELPIPSEWRPSCEPYPNLSRAFEGTLRLVPRGTSTYRKTHLTIPVPYLQVSVVSEI